MKCFYWSKWLQWKFGKLFPSELLIGNSWIWFIELHRRFYILHKTHIVTVHWQSTMSGSIWVARLTENVPMRKQTMIPKLNVQVDIGKAMETAKAASVKTLLPYQQKRSLHSFINFTPSKETSVVLLRTNSKSPSKILYAKRRGGLSRRVSSWKISYVEKTAFNQAVQVQI